MVSRHLSVMFTDMRGFTARTSAGSRARMTALIAQHEKLLLPVFRHFAGKVVKTIGDAFLVIFDSPTDAVLCGVAIQEVLRQHNAKAAEDERLEVRVAINSGEVDHRDNDVYGEPVNIAARLEGIAEAGEVYFTESVYLSMNKREAPSTEIGERTFQGIPHPIRVYKVTQDPHSELFQQLAQNIHLTDQGPVIRHLGPLGLAPKRNWWWVGLGAAAAIAALVAVAVLWDRGGPAPATKLAATANHAVETLLTEGNFRAALQQLQGPLQANPTDTALRELAGRAVNGYVDQLVKQGRAGEAMQWLRNEIRTQPILERHANRFPELDARVTVERIRTAPRNSVYVPMYEFADRHPRNGEPLYLAATLLEKDGDTFMPAWLYERALDRGSHRGDAQVLRYLTGQVLSKPLSHHPTHKAAHATLKKHYPAERLRWAREAMANGNAAAVISAWQILAGEKLPANERSYYEALGNAAQGKELDRALPTLAAETNPARRRHQAAVLQETVDRYPAYYNYGNVRDRITKELPKLGAPKQ